MYLKKFSIKSRLESFKYAFIGLKSLLIYEHNSRIHLLAALLAIFTGLFLKINPDEWALLIIVIGMVFITELMNSSLEKLSDSVTKEQNETIRKAKDYAAAAVLISAIISIVVGAIIFIPKLFELI